MEGVKGAFWLLCSSFAHREHLSTLGWLENCETATLRCALVTWSTWYDSVLADLCRDCGSTLSWARYSLMVATVILRVWKNKRGMAVTVGYLGKGGCPDGVRPVGEISIDNNQANERGCVGWHCWLSIRHDQETHTCLKPTPVCMV